MITCLLQGGLGNQMFQIAATIGAARNNDTNFCFSSVNHYLPLQGRQVHNYKDNIYSRLNIIDVNIENIATFNKYMENNYSYNKIILEKNKNYILNGYFQSEKYFDHISQEIKNLFAVPEKYKKILIEKYMLNENNNYISMHVRRGDYLKFPDVHPVCSEQYYTKSILKINELDKIDKILIFSDDIDWCKKAINFSKKFIFIQEEHDFMELYLMSLCKHNILANSSFSWWAAWINNNPEKIVIAPKIWFGSKGPQDTQDLIPKNWIVI
jgi:hypothetical protein